MEKHELKTLLDKYYNAETTLEEEALLRKYFSENECNDEFASDKAIFDYCRQLSGIPSPEMDFEERISSVIEEKNSFGYSTKRKLLIAFSGIAAGLVILAGSYLLINSKRTPADTFSDSRSASAAAMEILYMVSERINQGTQALEPVRKINDITRRSIHYATQPSMLLENQIKTVDKLAKNLEMIEK